MQRAFSIALSIAAVVLSAVLAFRAGASSGLGAPGVAGMSTADAGAGGRSGRGEARSSADAGETSASLGFAAEALALPETVPIDDAPVPAGGFHLADGTAVPPLPRGAPRHVRFGVVLVTYEGAEGAPDKEARHKQDALSLATKLGDEAKGDFRATVRRGDNGSTEDVGEVARGVLEPASEAVLFALPVGGVSGVIDTPRGFWIVKRLE